jgi:hypothetical protein
MIANNLINKLQNKRCKFLKINYWLKVFVGFKIIYQASNISWNLIYQASNMLKTDNL